MFHVHEKTPPDSDPSGSDLFAEPREERFLASPDVSAGDRAARIGSGADADGGCADLGRQLREASVTVQSLRTMATDFPWGVRQQELGSAR